MTWHLIHVKSIPYEMYSPMVAILVAAENATELPRLGKPRMKLSVQASQTALHCHLSVLWLHM